MKISFICILLLFSCFTWSSCTRPEGPVGPKGADIMPRYTDGYIRVNVHGALPGNGTPISVALTRNLSSASSLVERGTITELGSGNLYHEFSREGDTYENRIHFQIESNAAGTEVIAARAMFSFLEETTPGKYLQFSLTSDTSPSWGEDTVAISGFAYNLASGRITGSFIATRKEAPGQKAMTITGDFDSKVLSIINRPAHP